MKRFRNESLKKHTTFKIGGSARLLVIPETIDELKNAIKKSRGSFIILGTGSNLLFPDKRIKTTVIKTSKINHCVIDKTRVIAGAGLPLAKLVKITAKEGLSGLEFLAGIPGTVGGAVKGNAGAWRKSIGSYVELVKVFTSPASGGAGAGLSKKLTRKQIRFSYRKSNINGIIYEVVFKLKREKPSIINKTVKKYLKQRKNKHPIEPSAGSTFINPVAFGKSNYTAGQLIEKAGLKGMRVGDAEVSKKHANFIINRGKATAGNVKLLIKKIQKAVKNKCGIMLKPEVIFVE